LARSGWVLALNALLLTVTFRVGQLIVVDLLGAEQGGYLAAGSRLAEGFALVPEPLMLVLLPAFAAYDVAARGAQRALGVRVVRWLGVFALTIIVAASGSFAASLLAQVLLAVFPATGADVLACVRPLGPPFVLALACVLAGMLLPGAPLATGAIVTLAFIGATVAIGALGMDDVRLL